MRSSEFGMWNAEPDRVETGAGWRRGMLALCMIVGAVVMVQGAARLPCISRDGVFFVEYAQKLATEPLVQLRGQTKQPGYSILLLGLHSLIGRSISKNAAVSWEVCGQIIAVLGGVAVVGLIYLLTRRLFDVRTALVAALLAAFWPQLVTVSSDVLSDAPHLALYLGGLMLGVRAIEGKSQNKETETADGADGRRWGFQNADLRFQNGGMRWGTLVACGACCGVAYWLRQEALGAVAAVCVCLLWAVAGKQKKTAGLEDSTCPTLRRRVAQAGVVMAAFVIVVAPYSIAVGKVMPNKSIRDLLWGAEETESADGADGKPAEAGSREIIKRSDQVGPADHVLKYVAKTDRLKAGPAGQYFSSIIGTRAREAGPVTWWDAPIKMLGGWSRSGRYVLSTLALVGFFWPRAARSERGVRRLVMIAALLQIIAAQARGMQYGVVSERYLMIPAGLAIPWSAAGLVAIAKYVGGRLRRGREDSSSSEVARRSLMVAALIAVAPMAYYGLRPAKAGAGWQREAGTWIAGQAIAGDVVLAAQQHSAVAFYAGLERRWPVGADLTKPVTRPRAVWVVDDPGMSRATDTEKSTLAVCRMYLRADEPSRAWGTDGGGKAKVYRIVSGPTWETLRKMPPSERDEFSGGGL